MLNYQNAGAASDIQFERVGDVLTITLPKEGFVRGGGNLLGSWQFWSIVVLLTFCMNSADVVGWIGQALRGRLTTVSITPERVTLFLLQPVVMICGYVLVVAETATTIRLYRTELVRSTHGFLGAPREAACGRREIERVHVGWLSLSVERVPRRRGGMCRRVPLFTGRSRDERERVAAAIRTWLDERPSI